MPMTAAIAGRRGERYWSVWPSVILFEPILPFSLAFAGGAMLYVISDELIPESHSHSYEHQATFGFIGGFLLLLVLSHWLHW